MIKLLYPEKIGRVIKLIFSWLERPKSLLKKKSSKDFYTQRKWTIIIKILFLCLALLFVVLFYFQLKEPVYCCGEFNQKVIDDMLIYYNYDIKTEGGIIKTEKPVIFILYEFGIFLNMRGMDAENPPDNITRRMCVDGARNIITKKYEPCVDIDLKKESETILEDGNKTVQYEFSGGDGFEWKRKFIIPGKESISFAEKEVEYIDVISNQQSDVSIIYPFLIALTTIISLIMDACSKYLEIKQEELDRSADSDISG